MKPIKFFILLCSIPLFSYAAIDQNAKVCVLEAGQSLAWSISCDGQLSETGTNEKGQTNEMVISQQLAKLIGQNFVIQSCNGFPNSYGIRCILTK